MIQRRIQTEELDRLLDDFAQSHTNLLVRINALSNNLRAARLLGYSSRDIEELVRVIQVFIIEKVSLSFACVHNSSFDMHE